MKTKCSWCTVGIGCSGTGSTTATDRACTFMLGRADATTVIITIGVITTTTTTRQADFQAELGLAAGQPLFSVGGVGDGGARG